MTLSRSIIQIVKVATSVHTHAFPQHSVDPLLLLRCGFGLLWDGRCQLVCEGASCEGTIHFTRHDVIQLYRFCFLTLPQYIVVFQVHCKTKDSADVLGLSIGLLWFKLHRIDIRYTLEKWNTCVAFGDIERS